MEGQNSPAEEIGGDGDEGDAWIGEPLWEFFVLFTHDGEFFDLFDRTQNRPAVEQIENSEPTICCAVDKCKASAA